MRFTIRLPVTSNDYYLVILEGSMLFAVRLLLCRRNCILKK